MQQPVSQAPVRPAALSLMLIGVAGGTLSGLFGIGGGTIIVPALALWLLMPQKLSAGTSVAAILPTAIVGATTYAIHSNVDWAAAIALAVGIIIGAQVGSWLLSRVPVHVVRWVFMGFLAVVIVSLWFVVPQREDTISLTILTALLLVVTGFITGILSGLLGVGGGVVVVPVLMFFFGASDLVAKGTSLLMMIPGSISGTLGNMRRGNVDLRAAAFVGVAAAVFVPVGATLAGLLDPFWGNLAFSAYLLFLLCQMLVREVRMRRNAA
ncbi:sulfite exporter TauE/SafE family protein [Leucobacter sp. UCMA 4100]|uniref:sulfite exporter TauE/SafE family protein n=1 Tax=Leucobacter sp. UCMA 4100 TaxID=2810534 RepID=UPI0022EA51BF|nr:sulfite exporter TauE/SafE family protein [Leucobacter sp. UCMA 4100]MDA3146583.1 sulfite exporter TauE/SafE family protein [Leucobacter sp. UCMA 4100]